MKKKQIKKLSQSRIDKIQRDHVNKTIPLQAARVEKFQIKVSNMQRRHAKELSILLHLVSMLEGKP